MANNHTFTTADGKKVTWVYDPGSFGFGHWNCQRCDHSGWSSPLAAEQHAANCN